MTIAVKRIYDTPVAEDGYRILVDRLWPRGISREAAALGLWLRRIAPSDELRRWYGHDVARWPEFRERYRDELADHEELLGLLGDIERHQGKITLLFGARDEQHNEAEVLAEVLRERARATA